MDRCILRTKETGAIPYRNGTAYPLMDIPQNAVSAMQKSSRMFSTVDRIR